MCRPPRTGEVSSLPRLILSSDVFSSHFKRRTDLCNLNDVDVYSATSAAQTATRLESVP